MDKDKLAVLRQRLAGEALTPGDLMACAHQLRELAKEAAAAGQPVQRVAVACDLTPDLIAQAVACAIAQEGEWPLVHIAPFGTARQQCLDPASDLHAFAPDVVVLVPDWRHTLVPLPADVSAEDVDAADQAQLREFEAIWFALLSRNCAVIQNLLVPPVQQLRGVADRLSATSMVSRVPRFNQWLLQAGSGRVTCLETDRLAAQVGLAVWAPPRFHYAAKLGFDPRFLPYYLPWLRGAWRSATGRTKKLLVLDLDDTLWGGTIGDDGPDGIALGPSHGGRGEAFSAWQRYLAQLAQRGVVLAVCSKNAPALAAAGFEHPDSALKHEDFAAFVCSWEDKASGLRRIAAELDLGLDAMVFVDDNPAERALVAQMLPEVAVVAIGADPSQFIGQLESGHWFDLQFYTDADLGRSAAYAGRREAQAAQAGAVDLRSYLEGLQMTGRIAVAQASDLPRLAQMEYKTNQFNLTGRRYAQTQLAALMAQPGCLVLEFQLRDRFADHGLVSSLVAVRENEVLRIDSWLLSCRVFGRTAESFILAALVQMAREQGATALLGEYIASPRNGVVADLYARLGFSRISEDGHWWRRELAAPLDDWATSITNGLAAL